MALSPGTRLGQYETLALLGVGGMGEVYHARDRKLNREVALKLLPEHFARDPERILRFRRTGKRAAQRDQRGAPVVPIPARSLHWAENAPSVPGFSCLCLRLLPRYLSSDTI